MSPARLGDMKHALLATCVVAALASILATTTDSLGDPAKPALTPVQEQAKAKFAAQMADRVKRVKEACGVDLSMTTDFENYDENAWLLRQLRSDPELNKMYREEALQEAVGECAQVVGAIADSCTPRPTASPQGKAAKRGKGEAAPAQASPPTSPKTNVRSVACLFSGHQPAQNNDGTNDFAERNISLSNAVMTIHMGPRLPNIDYVAAEVLSGKVKDRDRKNGSACTKSNQCRSYACSSGTCQPCGERIACGGNRFCDRGTCWSRSDPDESTAQTSGSSASSKSEASAKKPKLKGLGQSCESSAECETRLKCKAVSKSRSTCR